MVTVICCKASLILVFKKCRVSGGCTFLLAYVKREFNLICGALVMEESNLRPTLLCDLHKHEDQLMG